MTARAEALRERSLGVALVLPLQPLRRALLADDVVAHRARTARLWPSMAAAMLWADGQRLRNLVRCAA